MTNQETPDAIPAPSDVPAAETADNPEEVGHLVKGLDFTSVIEYAKTLDIPGFEEYDNMVGSRPITIDGLPATVGWVGHRPGAGTEFKANETPKIKVENPGGEDIIVVEGHLAANVARSDRSRDYGLVQNWAVGNPRRPGFLQFNGGDSVWLRVAHMQHEPTWYVCFYPEAPDANEPEPVN